MCHGLKELGRDIRQTDSTLSDGTKKKVWIAHVVYEHWHSAGTPVPERFPVGSNGALKTFETEDKAKEGIIEFQANLLKRLKELCNKCKK